MGCDLKLPRRCAELLTGPRTLNPQITCLTRGRVMAISNRQGVAAELKGEVFETDLPARLDRLPWGRFHTLLVFALGITWLLDGLEVTLAGSVSGALKDSPVLHLTNTDIGLAGGAYISGAVLGALFFGWLTDRLGRRKLFFIP